jgi:S-methylmethionine-dependent homocysteine/selenocysteine methylase
MKGRAASDIMAAPGSGEFVLMDGALGTELERGGVPFEGSAWSALAVRDHGDIVSQTHADYIRAGSRLHIVNSFALARHVLEPLGLDAEFEFLNRRAVQLFDDAAAQSGIERDALWAAGSLSTFAAHSDRSLLPSGAALTDNYRRQAEILQAAGVDLMALEMLFDIDTSRAMLQAVHATGLPAILGFTCQWHAQQRGRVSARRDLGLAVQPLDKILPTVLEQADPRTTIVAVMHSDIDVTDAALEVLRRYWDGPLAVYPNSGYFIDLRMQFDSVCSPADFCRAALRWIDSGVQIVGGCCGIGPAHIEHLRAALGN